MTVTLMEEGRGDPVVPDADGLKSYEVYRSLDQPGLTVVVSHWSDDATPAPFLADGRSWRFERVG